jgi:hypothetical protein
MVEKLMEVHRYVLSVRLALKPSVPGLIGSIKTRRFLVSRSRYATSRRGPSKTE